MKKLLNVLLILAVVITNLFPANVLAATGRNTDTKGSITINNAVNGETYDIYKIFDILSYDTEEGIASYQVSGKWLTFIQNNYANKFELTASVVEGAMNIIGSTLVESDMAEFAKAALQYAKANNIAATDTDEAADNTVVFEDLDLGYYLVDTSVGTLCMIDSTTNEVEIDEKNDNNPDVDKTIVEDNGEKYEENTAKIGDTLTFSIVVSDIANLSDVKVIDKMEAGLTLNTTSIKVETTDASGSVVDVTTTYGTLKNVTGTGFEFDFKDDKLVGHTAEFTITYTAVVNSNAEIASDNENEVTLKYGRNPQVLTDSTTTKTYEMTLRKTDTEDNDLTGAIFTLKQLSSSTNSSMNKQILVVELANGDYRVAMENEEGATDSIMAGTVRIIGLENGTYELTETSAPEGYNKLAKPVEFEIADANITPESPKVIVNTSGMILPSTGGMGTVLFITVGSVMALGFGVNLVTKARMRKIED